MHRGLSFVTDAHYRPIGSSSSEGEGSYAERVSGVQQLPVCMHGCVRAGKGREIQTPDHHYPPPRCFKDRMPEDYISVHVRVMITRDKGACRHSCDMFKFVRVSASCIYNVTPRSSVMRAAHCGADGLSLLAQRACMYVGSSAWHPILHPSSSSVTTLRVASVCCVRPRSIPEARVFDISDIDLPEKLLGGSRRVPWLSLPTCTKKNSK